MTTTTRTTTKEGVVWQKDINVILFKSLREGEAHTHTSSAAVDNKCQQNV